MDDCTKQLLETDTPENLMAEGQTMAAKILCLLYSEHYPYLQKNERKWLYCWLHTYQGDIYQVDGPRYPLSARMKPIVAALLRLNEGDVTAYCELMIQLHCMMGDMQRDWDLAQQV